MGQPGVSKRKLFPCIALTLLLVGYFVICHQERYVSTYHHGKQCRTRFSRNSSNLKELKSDLFLKPKCDNILRNVTQGKWVELIDVNKNDVEDVEAAIALTRSKINFPQIYWRSDGKCGKNELLPGGKAASHCDPRSRKPCCSDELSGICGDVDSPACFCPACVDARKYTHAETAKWTPYDNRCQIVDYKPRQACSVLNKIGGSSASRFFFVGDSLIRNMFLGLMVTLSGQKVDGAMKNCLGKETANLCRGHLQFMLMHCLVESAVEISDVEHTTLCGGLERNFDVQFKPYFSSTFSTELLDLVQSLLHQNNTFVTVGIGVLDHCHADNVIDKYLSPVVHTLQQASAKWPRIIWVFPLTPGLIAPAKYWGPCNERGGMENFVTKVDVFLKRHDIAALDFRELTQHVHSHDGTHYGMAVNTMKSQIWLNYMATLA